MKTFYIRALLFLILTTPCVAQVQLSNVVVTGGVASQQFFGAWVVGTTYGINAIVTYSGSTYISIVTPNIGNTPNLSPSAWQPFSGSGGGSFAGLTGGTNLIAAMICGSGCTMNASGTGTIAATSAPYSGLQGSPPIWNQNTTGSAASAGTVPLSGVTAGASQAGTFDFSGATQFKLPVVASYTSSANGELGYDSTAGNWHIWANGADNIPSIFLASATITGGDCVQWVNTGGAITQTDAGAPCGSGSGATVSVNGSTVTNPNFNGTTPSPQTNFENVIWQSSGSNVSAQVPYGSSSVFGVLECGSGLSCTGGVISASASFGVSSFSGDGVLLSNSGSSGAVTATLGTAGGHLWFGNNTSSTATPGYEALTSGDIPNNAANTSGSAATLSAVLGTSLGGLGTGTNPVTGQIAIAQSGLAYAPETLSQDCTITSLGVITCLKTNNVAFGTAATVNTGTSGATIPLLNGTGNTWLHAQTFSAPPILTGLTGFIYGNGSSAVTVGTAAQLGTLFTTYIATVSGCTTATYVYVPADSACEAPSGGGSGTVNSGTAFSPAYYATTGTAVSGTTPFTGLEYWAGSAAPTAATAAQVVAVIGSSAVTNSQNTTNLLGGATGSAPYQSATSTTAFIASPTTSGNTFFYGWQPSGSAVNPSAVNLGTFLASPPAIGGTAPNTGSFTTLTASSTVSGAGITSLFASPPSIGSTTAGTIKGTTLTAATSITDTPLSTAGLVTNTAAGLFGTEANVTIAQGGTNATSAAAGTIPQASSGTASSWTATPTIGVTSTTQGILTMADGGQVILQGSTSGSTTLSVSATGGTLNLGSTSATVSSTGALTVTNCIGCGTVNFTFPLTVNGATNSGGMPYFSNTTTLTSSATLASDALMIGGGTGGAPSTDTGCSTNGAGALTCVSVSTTTSGGLGGTLTIPEGTAPSASAANDIFYGNAANHDVYVSLNNGSFFPLVSTATAPVVISAAGVISASAATSGALGVVQPDGTIITVASGLITVAKATAAAFGVVECGTGTSCTGGVISATGTAPRLDQVLAATANSTIANGNFQETFNYALTSGTVAGQTFGETTAATGANDVILQLKTLTTSTATGLQITQGANGPSGANAPPFFAVSAAAAGGLAATATSAGNQGASFTIPTGNGSAGGASTGNGGVGGDAIFNLGQGGGVSGASNTGGRAGNFTVNGNAGAAGGTVGGAGSTINLNSGNGGNGSSTGGVAGNINLLLGNPGTGGSPTAALVEVGSSNFTVDASGNTKIAGSLTVGGVSGTQTIASGTATMGTAGISSATCATAVTVSATGVLATDVVGYNPNADPTGVTGYAPSVSGSLYIWAYPTANNVNFRVCNPSSTTITPSTLTLNYRVTR